MLAVAIPSDVPLDVPTPQPTQCQGQCRQLFHPDDLSTCAFCDAGCCKDCDLLCPCQLAIAAEFGPERTIEVSFSTALPAMNPSDYDYLTAGLPAFLGMTVGSSSTVKDKAPAIRVSAA